jgi:predicted phage terminase large subunit-like protein
VLQIWARFGSGAYLVDELRARLSLTEGIAALEAWAARYPQVCDWIIERKANGEAILDTLAGRILGLQGVDPRGSKEARAASCAPMVEAGGVWVPASHVAPWVDEWVDELGAFPRGAHDDRVDAASQALRWLAGGAGLVSDLISPAQVSQPSQVAAGWGSAAW